VLPPPQESIETGTPMARIAEAAAPACVRRHRPPGRSSYQSQIVDDVQTDPARWKQAMADSGSATRRAGRRRIPTKAARRDPAPHGPKASRAIPTPANI